MAIVPSTKTKFAGAQYNSISAKIYNEINKELDIYSKPYKECKKSVLTWLESLDYDMTELFLQDIK